MIFITGEKLNALRACRRQKSKFPQTAWSPVRNFTPCSYQAVQVSVSSMEVSKSKVIGFSNNTHNDTQTTPQTAILDPR